jgi:hypothetical protein
MQSPVVSTNKPKYGRLHERGIMVVPAGLSIVNSHLVSLLNGVELILEFLCLLVVISNSTNNFVTSCLEARAARYIPSLLGPVWAPRGVVRVRLGKFTTFMPK